MSKQISADELAEIVTKLLTDPVSIEGHLDSPERFSGFMHSVAAAVCEHCGGEVSDVQPDAIDGEWLIGIHGNESLPDDGGIWKDYDVEGDLYRNLETPGTNMEITEADYEDFDAAVNHYGLDKSFQYHERPEIMLGYARQYRLDMARINLMESLCHLVGAIVEEDRAQPGMFVYPNAEASFPTREEALESAYFEASSIVREWHDLSPEFWASLNDMQRHELAAEMVLLDSRNNSQAHPDTLSESQIEAIEAFRESKGRMWKAALGACWERSHYPGMTTDHAATLQRLRNTHGPEWLSGFRVAAAAPGGVVAASEDEPARPPRPRC